VLDRFEIGPAKAPVASEKRQDLLSVEDYVNGLQRPILVEDDAITKDSGPIKQDAVVMQEIKQGVFVAHVAHFVADLVKFRSFQQTMLSLGRFALLAFLFCRNGSWLSNIKILITLSDGE
jgi:hypothetical protein